MNKLRLMSSLLVGKFSRASLTVIFPEVQIRKEAEIGLGKLASDDDHGCFDGFDCQNLHRYSSSIFQEKQRGGLFIESLFEVFDDCCVYKDTTQLLVANNNNNNVVFYKSHILHS